MSHKTPALVVLSPGFARDEDDSTCLPFLQSFLQELKRQNHHIEIIVIAFHYPYRVATGQWKNIQVVALNGRNKGKLHRLKLWMEVWKQLTKIKTSHHIRSILSFWCTETALVGHWFGRCNSIKHISWIQGQDAKNTNPFVKWIRPSASELVALSDFLHETFFINHGIRPAQTIAPGIDTRLFDLPPANRDIDVMGCGSLISLKQYDLFVELIYEVKKTNPGIRTVICGNGPQKSHLLQRVKELSLSENLHLFGELPHQQVLGLMQRTKVFLHTSSYEGFGIVCLEALYAGARVVSFVKPMKARICNWLVAGSMQEMNECLMKGLNRDNDHEPVIFQTIEQTAAKMGTLLFDKHTTAEAVDETEPRSMDRHKATAFNLRQ